MKNLCFILCLVFKYLDGFAQKTDSCYAGVYLTREDFLNKHLSYKINKDAKGYKFGFPPPADWKLEIKIVRPDTVVRFKEGAIYGYSECERQFRYSEGGELLAPEDFYRLEEVKGLVIYTSVFNGGDELFYSLDLTSKIHRLSIKNLEEDFKDQPEFIKAVKKLSRTGELGDIGKHDPDGHFMINKIYKEKIERK